MGDQSIEEGPNRKIPVRPDDETEALEAPISEQDAAAQEALFLARGLSIDEIEKEAAALEHERNQAFRDNFELMAIGGLWVAFLALIGLSGVWVLHITTPRGWHWLSPDQVSTIQNIVTGGIVAAALGDHFKRRLG